MARVTDWAEVNLRVPLGMKAEWIEAAGPRSLSSWIRDACNAKLVKQQAGPSTRVVAEPGACPKHQLKHCYSCKTGRYA